MSPVPMTLTVSDMACFKFANRAIFKTCMVMTEQHESGKAHAVTVKMGLSVRKSDNL